MSNPLGHYDDDREGFPPYRPEHPIREGFTMGVCFTVVVGLIIWLIIKAVS